MTDIRAAFKSDAGVILSRSFNFVSSLQGKLARQLQARQAMLSAVMEVVKTVYNLPTTLLMKIPATTLEDMMEAITEPVKLEPALAPVRSNSVHSREMPTSKTNG